MLEFPYILIGYALLGAGIKYADQAYDIGVFNKRKANIVAVLTAILMVLLIVFDSPSTIILLSILFTVAITKKIDNIAFYIGTGILLLILLTAMFLGIGDQNVSLMWLPFSVLLFSGIIDEIGNDWSDVRCKKKRMYNLKNNLRNNFDNSPIKEFLEVFFAHRWTLKLTLFLLTVTTFFPYLYLIAFILFDLTYALVEWYSFNIKTYHLSNPLMAVKNHFNTSISPILDD